MRVKLGRPDLGRYQRLFDVPGTPGELTVTFAGVASLCFDDGTSAVLTDGFFSRPPLRQVLTRKLQPDRARIQAGLWQLGASSIDAIVPVHSHFDHALDSAEVAAHTGAFLVGGTSVANLGRGAGLPDDQIRTVASYDTIRAGNFSLTLIASRHCPPDRFPGEIVEPLTPPARASAYRCGEAWSLRIEHAGGRTALVQGSAGYVAGALAGQRAEVAYLGVGQLGVQDPSYIREYWEHTVRAVGARRVMLIHFDDFFRPLDKPLRPFPRRFDDLDATLRVLEELADHDDVLLHFPTVWRRENPWHDL